MAVRNVRAVKIAPATPMRAQSTALSRAGANGAVAATAVELAPDNAPDPSFDRSPPAVKSVDPVFR